VKLILNYDDRLLEIVVFNKVGLNEKVSVIFCQMSDKN